MTNHVQAPAPSSQGAENPGEKGAPADGQQAKPTPVKSPSEPAPADKQ